jgi:hypothetical protein
LLFRCPGVVELGELSTVGITNPRFTVVKEEMAEHPNFGALC